jgi:hypothetical protein
VGSKDRRRAAFKEHRHRTVTPSRLPLLTERRSGLRRTMKVVSNSFSGRRSTRPCGTLARVLETPICPRPRLCTMPTGGHALWVMPA